MPYGLMSGFYGHLADLYGGGGGGMGAAPQRRLSIEDLLPSMVEPEYPEAPVLPRSTLDLDPEEQRRMRINRLIQTLGAGFAGAGEGRMGTAMWQGLGHARANEQNELAGMRDDRERQYERDRQQADIDARRKTLDSARTKEATGLFQAYEEVQRAAHPNDSATLDRAAQAARAGDKSTLAKLVQEATTNRFWFDKGINPADPMAMAAAEREQKVGDAKAMAQAEGEVRQQFREPRQPSPLQFERGYVFDPNSGAVTKAPGFDDQGAKEAELQQEAVSQAVQQRARLIAAKGGRDEGVPPVDAMAREIYNAYRSMRFANVDAGASSSVPGANTIAPPPSPMSSGGDALSAAAGASPLAAVSDPKAKAWAQAQLDAGAPLESILAQLRKFGAL